MVQQDNILYGANTHPALPISAADSLVKAAAAKLAPGSATCLVSLPGLSAWVRDGERWDDEGKGRGGRERREDSPSPFL
jgi:hypothetical protein